jgi:hypothetical protein
MLQGNADHDMDFLSHVGVGEHQSRPSITVNLRVQPPHAGEDPTRHVVERCRHLTTLKLGDEYLHNLLVELWISCARSHGPKLGQPATGRMASDL